MQFLCDKIVLCNSGAEVVASLKYASYSKIHWTAVQSQINPCHLNYNFIELCFCLSEASEKAN